MAEQEPATAIAEPVAEPKTRPTPRRKTKPKRQPPYHVILWDDNDHTHAYVIHMLQKLFGYPAVRGYQIAVEVDTRGRAIVCTTTLERAELKRDQIHAFGKDDLSAGCKGSMSATIEPSVS